MNRVAILGGMGFVGTNLSRKFDLEGIFYKVFDKNIKKEADKFSFIDIEDQKSLMKLEGFDTIINLAAIHRDDVKPKSKYFDVNVRGSRNICDAAEILNIKNILFLSSAAVYGFSKNAVRENSEINYFNEYGKTKFLAENVYRRWYKKSKKNKKLTIIRPTVIFGEGNKGNVYNLINQIFKKRFIIIGNGENKKSLAYVDNVSAFIVYCLKNNKGYDIYNYADKPDMTMNQLVLYIKKSLLLKEKISFRVPYFLGIFMGFIFDIFSFITKTNFPISSVRIKKFVNPSVFEKKETKDFIPPFTIHEGLSRTISRDFLKNHSNK
ncbi:MAG: NAD(P)-dependent oxidoreductase [Gammaproteobacteria bacterium]|nr:MAG: NAD(P)-dependent oxidoreductase [Gammaproteobacteria bacterium]